MTREEAFKYGTEWLKDEYLDSEDREFIKIAIEALKQEPCEDAISRQAVDRLVWRYLKKGTDENIAFYEHFLELSSVTPQEPYFWEKCPYYEPDIVFDGKDEYDMGKCTYKQEPKTGHWIRWYEQKENDFSTEFIPHCKCSECGKEYDPHSSQFIKFCNECGAKMEEEE